MTGSGATPTILVSGFGPFEDVDRNASGLLAARLAADGVPGVVVRGVELAVSFSRSIEGLDQALAACGEARALLGLGVHRGDGFRLERCARPQPVSARPDVDGALAGAFGREGAALESALDARRLIAALERGGAAEAWISDDAGGYVCEWLYHHLLARAGERSIPAVFLHVPRVEKLSVEGQLPVVRALVREIADQVASSMRGRASADAGDERAKARKAGTNSTRSSPM